MLLQRQDTVVFLGESLTPRTGMLSSAVPARRFALLTRLQERQIRVVQLSTSPSPGRPDKNEILRQFDKVISSLSRKFGNQFVDIKPTFGRIERYKESAAYPIQLFNDGCHLSELRTKIEE
ncbi:hypothetical protein GC096_07645 [Paenibacillus sp. LMG 31461]|uniref:SGNH hydrolase-type esterase domain-containing protein n=1 Tax=Paenibacillus plantarum TaxID=2654975 RepID=A0ABX1X693_9BACL|nr:hypothetical protein [Paenibacillus plantarum]NOU63896.1 hypothetical protein [Paenibacillus plantarum]